MRLRDSFIHKNHLCLVFEQLSSNLYELIKQNQFQGLSTQLVKVFTGQLLDALTVLKEARLIHCDLKPENILLKTYVYALMLFLDDLFFPQLLIAYNHPKSKSLILVQPVMNVRPFIHIFSHDSIGLPKYS